MREAEAEAEALVFLVGVFPRMAGFAEGAYPFEGCGVLLGTTIGQRVLVNRVLEGRNLVSDRRRDRYELDPRDILRAEREARDSGQEVIGFFHTHPDHPARPSQVDTDRAWPGYHYVVISVSQGRLAAATAWRLVEGEEPSRFLEVALKGGLRSSGYNLPGLVAEAP